MKSTAVWLLLLFVAGVNTQAQDVETFLFPIPAGTTQGAFGSRWEVRHDWRNGGTSPVCYALVGLPEPVCLPPGASEVHRQTTAPGRMTFAGDLERMYFSIVARDVSRQDETWGAEVPVVPMSRFRSTEIELINVPTDHRFRRNLRLYIDGPSATLHVRVWDAAAELRREPSRLLSEVAVELTDSQWYTSLTSAIDLPVLSTTDLARIEVKRVAGDATFWGFLTVTNNLTHHVTTISPR